MKRRWLLAVLGLAGIGFVILFGKWREGTRQGGQKPAEPFRIAGNLYYVGANDIASFLIRGPQGHILIDGGYPGTPRLIMASIAKLGFDIRDVKVLLNSEPHYDHAGGLAELQKASGAQLWASAASADAIEAGGAHPDNFVLFNILVFLRITRYEPARVHHRFEDGARIAVGPTTLTAHITGGHTRGCTTFTFPVHDGDRTFDVVFPCSLSLLPGMRLVEPQRYAGIREDFERTFRVLRSLPQDIFVTAHARDFGRYRKFVASKSSKDPVVPFVDREGYLATIDSAEAKFRRLLAKQQQER